MVILILDLVQFLVATAAQEVSVAQTVVLCVRTQLLIDDTSNKELL